MCRKETRRLPPQPNRKHKIAKCKIYPFIQNGFKTDRKLIDLNQLYFFIMGPDSTSKDFQEIKEKVEGPDPLKNSPSLKS